LGLVRGCRRVPRAVLCSLHGLAVAEKPRGVFRSADAAWSIALKGPVVLLVQHQFCCEVACRSCLKGAISGSCGGV
jgi:hypothetical protein